MAANSVRVYLYNNCDTCRKAVRWLNEHDVQREEIPIRQQPPTVPELQRMLAVTGDLRKLFNISGTDYKALGMKDRLPKLTEAEALELLSGNGNLVKRPFLLTATGGAVGFKAEEWEKLLRI
ncbi:MAG: Spx/MgsR family RNA polymerase-binding regulatory protein [Verrucomicrobiota bacterium]